jgi:two-component system response regulator AtoC
MISRMPLTDPPELIDTEDERRRGLGAPPAPEERLYLLILEGNTSSLCPLPRTGTLLVGRSPSADIQVQDSSVSRQHARVMVEDGEVHIADLDSHNGIRVNGERTLGSHALHSGDVVTLGNVTLVFHCGQRPRQVRPVLDTLALRARLAEEIDRVRSYERAVSVLALEPGASSIPLPELVRAANNALRLMDMVGQAGSSLMVVLPELAGEEAEEAARHLLEVLLPLASGIRGGLATAPQDGLSADALLAAARAAALAAPPEGLQISGPALYQLSLGERSIVVADPAMVRLFELLRRLASSPIPVLIHGETGSGKENAAWAVHHWSSRAEHAFVALNCAALPENLVESELFGFERGAFSGADKPRAGLFERASGGTLFLDEVAELPLSTQAKLLRALDLKRITRLGDSREREVDLRVVAATHRVLAEEVKAGRFREDLFFRLSAAVVTLPPLRDRPRELPLLASTFLEAACERAGRAPLVLSAAARDVLGAYAWPGNVRELKNAMEYVAATSPGPIVEPSSLPAPLYQQEPPSISSTSEPSAAEPSSDSAPARRVFRPVAEELRQLERQRMVEALAFTGGVQTRAAQLIGMPLRTFAFKLKQYKLTSRSGLHS